MMMKLPYGIANFETIRTEGCFYVDKTRYLECARIARAIPPAPSPISIPIS